MVARLNDMVGLDVFTEDGKHIGILEDISVDPETGRVLGIAIKDVSDAFLKRMGVESRRGIVIPYAAVKAVGDIILMKIIAYGAGEEL